MSVNASQVYSQGAATQHAPQQPVQEQSENPYNKQYAMSVAPAGYNPGMVGYGVTTGGQQGLHGFTGQFVQGVGNQAVPGQFQQFGMIRPQHAMLNSPTLVQAGTVDGSRLPAGAAGTMGLSPNGQNMQIVNWQMVQNPGMQVAQVVGGIGSVTVQTPQGSNQVAPYTQVINNPPQVMNIQPPVANQIASVNSTQPSQAMVYPVVQAYTATADSSLTNVVGYNPLVPSSAATPQQGTVSAMNFVNVQNVAHAFPASATVLQAVNVNGQNAVVVGGATQQVQTMLGVNQNVNLNQGNVAMNPGGVAMQQGNVNQVGVANQGVPTSDQLGHFSSAVTLNVCSNSVVTQSANTSAAASTTYMTMVGHVVTQVSSSQPNSSTCAGIMAQGGQEPCHTVQSTSVHAHNSNIDTCKRSPSIPASHQNFLARSPIAMATGVPSSFPTSDVHRAPTTLSWMNQTTNNVPIMPMPSTGHHTHSVYGAYSSMHGPNKYSQGAIMDNLSKSKCLSAKSDSMDPRGLLSPSVKPSCIRVPFGWKRMIESGIVLYISPSNVCLRTREELMQYLQTDGTCKCGLECPLLVDRSFSFDPSVPSKEWTSDEILQKDDLTKLCNHKRKITAMAALQHNTALQQGLAAENELELDGNRDGNHSRKKKGKVKQPTTPYDNMWVSQLLSQREKIKPMNNFPMGSSAAEMLKLQASRNMQWNQGDKMPPDHSVHAFSKPNFNDSPLSCQLAAMAQEKQVAFQKGSQSMHQNNPNHAYNKFNSVLQSKFPNHVMKPEQGSQEGSNQNMPPMNPVWHNAPGVQGHMGQGQNMPGLVNRIQPGLHSPGNPDVQQYKQNLTLEQKPNQNTNINAASEGPSKPKKRKIKKERRKVNNLLEQKRGAPCPNVNVKNLQGDSCIPKEASLSGSDNVNKSTSDLMVKEESMASLSVETKMEPSRIPDDVRCQVNESKTSNPLHDHHVPATESGGVFSRDGSVEKIKSENIANDPQPLVLNHQQAISSSQDYTSGLTQTQNSTPNSVVSLPATESSQPNTAHPISQQSTGSNSEASYPANRPASTAAGAMQFPASTLLSAAARAQGEGRPHAGFTNNPHFQQEQATQQQESAAHHHVQQFGQHHPGLRYPGANMGVQVFPGHMQPGQGQNQMNPQTVAGQFQGMASPHANPYVPQQVANPRMMAHQWYGARQPGIRPPHWSGHPPSQPQGTPTPTATATHAEPSPIQKVQSMVHGLEVAQQAIEAAQAQRGYQRSSSVSSGRSSTRPPSKGSQGGTTPIPRMTPQRPLMSPPGPQQHIRSPIMHPTPLPTRSASPKDEAPKSHEYNPYDFPSNEQEEEVKEDTKESIQQQESPDSGIPRTPQPSEEKDVTPLDGEQENVSQPEDEADIKQECEASESHTKDASSAADAEIHTTEGNCDVDERNTSSEMELKDVSNSSVVEDKDESFNSKTDLEDTSNVSDHPVEQTPTSTVGSGADNQSNTSSNTTPSKSPSTKSTSGRANKPKRKRDRSKKAKAAAAANSASTSPQGQNMNPYSVPHMYGPQGATQRWPNMIQQQQGPGQFYPQQMQQAVQGQIPYAQGQMPYGNQANPQMQMGYSNIQQMNIMQSAYGPAQAQNPQMQANFDPSAYPYHQLNMNQMQQMVAAQNMQMQMSPGHAGAGMVQQQQWGMMANQMQGHPQMYPGGGSMPANQQGVGTVQGYNSQLVPPQSADQLNMQAMQGQQQVGQVQGEQAQSGSVPVQSGNPHHMHPAHQNPRNMENFVMSPTSSDYGGPYGFGCELPSPCKLTRAVNAVVQSQDFDQSGLDFPSITEEQTLANITSGVDQQAAMENSTDCSLTPASCAMNNSGEYAGSVTYSDAELARRSSMSDSAYSETENTVSCSHQGLPQSTDPTSQINSMERDDGSVHTIVRNGPTSRMASDSDDTQQHDSAVTDVYNFEDQDEADIQLPNNNSDQENEVMNSQIACHPLKPGKLPPPSDLLPKITSKLPQDTVTKYDVERRDLVIGDLVWGQIQGYPSWPGKIVRPEDVPGPTETGPEKVWVRWFGDHTFSEMEKGQLKNLSDGSEAYHKTKRNKKGRKANAQLETAVQEMMEELTMSRRNNDNYHTGGVDGYFNNHRTKKKTKV